MAIHPPPWPSANGVKRLEYRIPEGESPVAAGADGQRSAPKYHPARETGWEAGRPTAQDLRPSDTDSGKYREGTVKSPPSRGVKEILKPCADKPSESSDDGVPIEE